MVIINKIIANIINEPIIDEHIDSSLVSENLLLFWAGIGFNSIVSIKFVLDVWLMLELNVDIVLHQDLNTIINPIKIEEK